MFGFNPRLFAHLEPGALNAELSEMTHLEYVMFPRVGASGHFPNLTATAANLEVLRFEGNQFDAGPVLAWISDASQLKFLMLNSCNFTGGKLSQGGIEAFLVAW